MSYTANAAQMDTRTRERALEWTRRPDAYLSPTLVESFLGTGAWAAESYVDLLERHAAARPEAPAIVDQTGATMSWGEFKARSDAFAAALLDLGYRPGDRLGIQLPNWSEFCVAVLGSARIGVVPVFMHTPYRAYELEYILGLTEARGLLVPATYRRFDHLALARDVQQRLPTLRDIIVARAEPPQGMLAFDDLVLAHRGKPPTVAPPVSTDLFVVMFTSGTTGRPKGVMHLHANLLNATRNYERDFALTGDDRWLIVTPLTHLTAFGIAFLGGVLTAGGCGVLQEAWDASGALALAEEQRVTHFVGAPPMLIDVARSPELDGRDLAALRFMMYAGAPCPIEILRRLHERLGCALTVFYGWTEGLAHTYSLPDDPLEVTSVTIGRTGPGWEYRVVDDHASDVPTGAQGEFWGRGPNLSPGYYHQPDFMADRYHPDGWFMSGDIVTLNADGTYTFVARKDDLINRGGLKIDPREVEELLYQHPQIAQAVVVGTPDERLGQRSIVYVVPSGDATLDLPAITRFLEERGLAKFKWPERLEIVERLPMTPTGKIMRYALREQSAAPEAVGS